MSNNIRIYSDDDRSTAIELRRVRHDDIETNNWRKPCAAEGALVVDILGSGGYRETTFDVEDLFRLMKREFPEQFAELVTAPALTSKEACFAELLTLEKTMSELIETARSGRTEHDDPWEEAYDSIFCDEVFRRICAIFDEMGIHFDYYDPDMGYDDDVLAFYNAAKDKLEELKPDYPYVVGLQR
jgi:hypothetical protein